MPNDDANEVYEIDLTGGKNYLWGIYDEPVQTGTVLRRSQVELERGPVVVAELGSAASIGAANV